MIKFNFMRILFLLIFSLLWVAPAIGQEYITDNTLENTLMVQDDQIKVLYFTAPWCGPCRYMKPIVQSIHEDQNLDVSIYKMNTDENTVDDILGVNSIPSYFFIKNGRKLGQSNGAMKRAELVALIKKHDRMAATGEVLAYKGKSSKYTLIAGAHPKLTVENLKGLWHDARGLNELSWKIQENLEATQDLECALVLINRSLELETYTSNLETRAFILDKLDRRKQALKAAQKARNHASKNKAFTGRMDQLVKKLQTE